MIDLVSPNTSFPMDLSVRKALTHIADRQQIKVRNTILKGRHFHSFSWEDGSNSGTRPGAIA